MCRCVNGEWKEQCHSIAYLCHNFGIRIQVQKTPSKLRGGRMVISFGKYADGAAQGNLQMSRLHLTVSEVCGKLQAPADIVRLFLGYSSSLQFNGDTKQIFAR